MSQDAIIGKTSFDTLEIPNDPGIEFPIPFIS